MSKKIKTRTFPNGTVVTRTTGNPEGDLPTFDITVNSPPRNFKKPTTMQLRFGDDLLLNLTGRQFRTLLRVCEQHSSTLEIEETKEE